MLDRVMAAGFEDVVEADDVAIDVYVRVIDGISHTRLRREIHHNVKVVLSKEPVNKPFLADRALDESVLDRTVFRRLFDKGKAVFLERRVVVVIHIVQTDDRAAAHFFKKPNHKIRPNEAGRACDKNGFVVQIYFLHLISPEKIPRIDLLIYIVERSIITVCDDAAAHLLELFKVVDHD